MSICFGAGCANVRPKNPCSCPRAPPEIDPSRRQTPRVVRHDTVCVGKMRHLFLLVNKLCAVLYMLSYRFLMVQTVANEIVSSPALKYTLDQHKPLCNLVFRSYSTHGTTQHIYTVCASSWNLYYAIALASLSFTVCVYLSRWA